MSARHQFVLFALLLVILATISAPAGGPPTTYTITDLGSLGGDSTEASGINHSGQITGSSYLSGDTAQHAFLYTGSTMLDIGSLGGQYCGGWGINDHGWITGSSQLPGNAITHAWLYDGVSMRDLGTLGGTYSSGNAINNDGVVTGSAYLGGDTALHAFVYAAGAMQDIGTLGGGSSSGFAINSSGNVAGSSFTSANVLHAFLYSGGTLHDLGTLPGGTSSVAFGVNDLGQVTGRSTLSGNPAGHAFLFDGVSMIDLGTLGGSSTGTDVNNHGVVVGASDGDGVGGYTYAFVYTGGGMFDLNTLIPANSGWRRLIVANAINDAGQIVGWGRRSDGTYGGFLLTPAEDITPPTITIVTSPAYLWPPNGQMVPVTIYGAITDDSSGVNASTAAYTVEDDYGQVHPSGPVVVAANGSYSFTVLLQARRDGQDLDGRHYTVTVRAKDNAGNQGAASATVVVPHDAGT